MCLGTFWPIVESRRLQPCARPRPWESPMMPSPTDTAVNSMRSWKVPGMSSNRAGVFHLEGLRGFSSCQAFKKAYFYILFYSLNRENLKKKENYWGFLFSLKSTGSTILKTCTWRRTPWSRYSQECESWCDTNWGRLCGGQLAVLRTSIRGKRALVWQHKGPALSWSHPEQNSYKFSGSWLPYP